MDLKIKIFADGADKDSILKLYREGFVKGFTTNPTLMRNAGINDYEAFARDILGEIRDLPFSLEVFSDDFSEMKRQALKIAKWGQNVYVKIPITNTAGKSSQPLIRELAAEGVQLNVTALLTLEQVRQTCESLKPGVPSIVSVFAGRVADTGVDPVPLMCQSKTATAAVKGAELLWASCRELFNIVQAEQTGCDIVTVTHDLLKKRHMFGKPLPELSLDTVKMFYDDAQRAGFQL